MDSTLATMVKVACMGVGISRKPITAYELSPLSTKTGLFGSGSGIRINCHCGGVSAPWSYKITYHSISQCVGLVDNFNRTLLAMLSMAVQDHPNKWEGLRRRAWLTTPVCIPPCDTHHSISCSPAKLECPLTLCMVLQHPRLHHLRNMLTTCNITWSGIPAREYGCSWVTTRAASKNYMTIQVQRDGLATFACDT